MPRECLGRNIRGWCSLLTVMGSIGKIAVAAVLMASLMCLAAAEPVWAGVTSSSAAPEFTELPAPGGRVFGSVTVGDRYVVYRALAPGQTSVSPPDAPMTLSIADTLTMTTRQLTLPAGCFHSGYKSLHDRVLMLCGGAFVYDSATLTPVAGPLPMVTLQRGVSGVGDEWVAGDSIASPKPAERLRPYYNWHSGKVRWLNVVKHPDLDDPKLGAAVICAPFERMTRIPSNYGRPISSYLYYAPQDGRTAYVLKGKGSRKAVYAGRCGGTGRLTRVHSVAPYTTDPGSITNRWSAWTTRGCQLHSYDDPTHRIYTWTTSPPRSSSLCFDLIGKTRYAVVTLGPGGQIENPYEDGRGAGPTPVYQLAIAPRPQ